MASLEPGGRDAELACFTEQVATFRLIDDSAFSGDYVQGPIDTIDDPASLCWNNPDRRWQPTRGFRTDD